MEASVVDLRYHMKEVLEALERRENVKILYHGKVKAIITPVKTKTDTDEQNRVQNHPLFGISKSEKETEQTIDELRSGRY